MLVPVNANVRAAPRRPASQRPDAAFLAQLIAMAEHDPQTRKVRRASAEDAMSAYGENEASGTGRSLSRLV